MAYKHKPPKRRYPAGTIGTVYFKTIVGGRRLEGDRLIIDAYDDNFYYVRVVNEIEETYSIALNNFVPLGKIKFKKNDVVYLACTLTKTIDGTRIKSNFAERGDKVYIFSETFCGKGYIVSRRKDFINSFQIWKEHISLAHPF